MPDATLGGIRGLVPHRAFHWGAMLEPGKAELGEEGSSTEQGQGRRNATFPGGEGSAGGEDDGEFALVSYPIHGESSSGAVVGVSSGPQQGSASAAHVLCGVCFEEEHQGDMVRCSREHAFCRKQLRLSLSLSLSHGQGYG